MPQDSVNLSLTLTTLLGLPYKIVQNFNGYFTNYYANTRHVCTYLNAFSTVIPNMVMRFRNFEFCKQFCEILDYLSSAHAPRVQC